MDSIMITPGTKGTLAKEIYLVLGVPNEFKEFTIYLLDH
jgi:hypothetical protein